MAQGAAANVDAMSTDRPQYGEYATPDEQRIRAGLPPLGADPAPPAPPAPVPAPSAARPATSGAGRLVTFALLGFGLFNVLSSIPGFLDLPRTLSESMRILGLEGEFTNVAAARNWGVIALIVLMAGYAATVWLSVRRMRAGASSWWVPLVGFVVTMFAVSLCLSVPMFGDPAFTQGMLTPPAG